MASGYLAMANAAWKNEYEYDTGPEGNSLAANPSSMEEPGGCSDAPPSPAPRPPRASSSAYAPPKSSPARSSGKNSELPARAAE